MSGALAGLRVVDCSRLIAGGVLATILAGHGADDTPVHHQRHRAPAEDELVVAEGRDVVGEELALAESLLEVEGGRVEGRRGVGLRAGDLGCYPERPVHPVTDDQVPGVVDDRDGDLEAERLRLGDTALDTGAGAIAGERHLRRSPPRCHRRFRS